MKAALAKQRGVPSLELNVSNCMDLHQMRIIVKHPDQMTRVRALCPSLSTHQKQRTPSLAPHETAGIMCHAQLS